jgi:hypothetical protein
MVGARKERRISKKVELFAELSVCHFTSRLYEHAGKLV